MFGGFFMKTKRTQIRKPAGVGKQKCVLDKTPPNRPCTKFSEFSSVDKL
jgi:hypothetical protein